MFSKGCVFVDNMQILTENIQCFQKLIYSFDAATYYHCQKVQLLSLLIGNILELPETHTELICRAALLHDLGKICIPKTILYKKEVLSQAEWALIREHPLQGADILASDRSPALESIIPLVLSHHERMDGTGYPYGIKGREIPLGSRIIAIADSLDAIISFRPYTNGAKTVAEALQELVDNAGTQFDEEIVCKVIQWAGNPTF